ncbi:hypothetical protein ILUMI_01051 [Ignelater luminosus]|uniref:Uncharacterized protein n=1 Tax=Ignelater luminosus TaxID=2038154 RepID=A0A8K0DG25_IGNLU|nr:hypothetical protein ILUMI_01051 [Ignelater luminosus]
MPEKLNENLEDSEIDIFEKKLNVHVPKEAIERIHRTGRHSEGKTRPVIIKFLSYETMQQVLNNKKKLKVDRLKTLFDKHAPWQQLTITKKPTPWSTDNVKLLITLRDKPKDRFKRTKSAEAWEYYRMLRNYTTTAIRNEKKAYLQSKIQNNSKMLWKELKRLSVVSSKKDDPNLCGNVDEVNDYFINSVPLLPVDNTVLEFYANNTTVHNRFSFRLISNEDVLKIIKSLKSNAVGSNNINANMIKLSSPYIVQFVVYIPIAKTEHPAENKDFRPISIVPTLSKIFEKVINSQLREHLSYNNLLPVHQSGSRPGHNTSTALLNITDDVYTSYDNGKTILRFKGLSGDAVAATVSAAVGLGRSVNRLAVPPVTINGVAVPFVDETKNLGLPLVKSGFKPPTTGPVEEPSQDFLYTLESLNNIEKNPGLFLTSLLS